MSLDVQIPVDCLINVSPRMCLSFWMLGAQKLSVINVTKCLGSAGATVPFLCPHHTKGRSRDTGLVMWRKSLGDMCGVGGCPRSLERHKPNLPRGFTPQSSEWGAMHSSEVHGTRCRKPGGPDTVCRGVEAGICADLFHSLLTKSIWSSPVTPERGDGPAGLRKKDMKRIGRILTPPGPLLFPLRYL